MGRLKIQTWPDRQTVPTTTTPLTPHQHIDKNNAPTHDSRLRSRSCFLCLGDCATQLCVCVCNRLAQSPSGAEMARAIATR